MLADVFSGALWTLLGSLVVFVGILVYATLIRQISARRLSTIEQPPSKLNRFEWPEGVFASVLVSLLLLGMILSIGHSPNLLLNTPESVRNFLLGNFLIEVAPIFVIAAFLVFRGFDIESLAGLSKTSFKRVISTAIILLLAAIPLIFFAEALTRNLFGSGSSRQEIVDLFNTSRTIGQRVMIIVLAVVIAPMSEEFIFRFFLYGVLRRYFGIAVALVFNSLLFAAAHTHLPSAAPLFVLGACFTLAYEWSGSILVSMGMHALFNSTQLIFLAFPDLLRQ